MGRDKKINTRNLVKKLKSNDNEKMKKKIFEIIIIKSLFQ
jgi:hypothetical protein